MENRYLLPKLQTHRFSVFLSLQLVCLCMAWVLEDGSELPSDDCNKWLQLSSVSSDATPGTANSGAPGGTTLDTKQPPTGTPNKGHYGTPFDNP